MPGESVNDYIYSSENLRYTPWRKVFALFPVTTVTNQRVWLKFVYKRKRWLFVEPPQFPVNRFKTIQYATANEIAEKILSGEWDDNSKG